MESQDIKGRFNEIKSLFNIDFEPKEEQYNVVKSVMKKRNVLGLLPTGFGKTFCMVMPSMLQHDADPITIIISPLTSLIDDQMSSIQRWNISCAKISALGEMDKSVVTGRLL